MGFLDNLINGFNKLVDVIFDGIAKIIEFFQVILDFITDLLSNILIWFESCWYKFVELIDASWQSALSGFIGIVPNLSSYYEDFGSAANYVSYADQWVNISLASSLLIAYAVFAVSFSVAKISIKMIPTIG